MATPTYNTTRSVAVERKTLMTGYLFGAPLGDLGWFASLLMGLASGMAAFFAATFVGIMSILFWNAAGHHADFTISYRLVGLPVGATVMVLALGYLGMLWARRISRK
jgi:ABC-type dipeptide/oligopeptide/nickel transport system permease subunit